MLALFALILIVAAVFWFKKQEKENQERKYLEQLESKTRSQEINTCLKWFDDDYAAFDRYLEDYQSNRLFFPVHINTLYFEDIGGTVCENIYTVLSALVNDMQENQKILEKYQVSGTPERLNKIQRCQTICSKYYKK